MKIDFFCLASLLALSTASAQTPSFRGVWVDAWHDGFKSAGQVSQLAEDVRAAHLNAVFAQMVRRGDAFYPSSILPATIDPTTVSNNFNCLEGLLEACHNTNGGPRIEVHAWLVMYPAASTTKPSQQTHVFNAHPDWFSQTRLGTRLDGVEKGYWLDPGHPAVQRHLTEVALELVKNYDVDGLTLDYLRYPGKEWGYNPVAVERFNALHGRKGIPNMKDPEWTAFRREQVTALLRKIYLLAIEAKPQIKVSAVGMAFSPAAGPSRDWTRSGTFNRALQDWPAWSREGIVDMCIPLDFYKFDTPERTQAFNDWAGFARSQRSGRHTVLSTGNYLVPIPVTVTQLRTALSSEPAPACDGVSLYSYSNPSNGSNSWQKIASVLAESVFPSPVPVPEMPWKTHPAAGHLKGYARSAGGALDGATLMISGPETRSTKTDATGFYGFVNLPPGTYSVVAEGNGFLSSTNSVDIGQGRVSTGDLQLDPAPGR